jgi:hypothetical protein
LASRRRSELLAAFSVERPLLEVPWTAALQDDKGQVSATGVIRLPADSDSSAEDTGRSAAEGTANVSFSGASLGSEWPLTVTLQRFECR